MKVYITKYALTYGIKEGDAEISDGMAIVKINYTQYFHGKEWHYTKEEAIGHAEIMRERKIASLQKNIKKLEAIRFD